MEGRETGREGKREKGKEREKEGKTEERGKKEGRKQKLTKEDGACRGPLKSLLFRHEHLNVHTDINTQI